MCKLVTGGMGYIGSHTVVQLLESGEDVVILDNLSNSKKEIEDKIITLGNKKPIFIKGDIRDEVLLDKIFKKYDIQVVIHFAGLKAVGESVVKPLEYYDNNVNGTLVLLKVMKKYNCKKIVFSSSATVYGMNEKVPFEENYPLSAINPYGASKLMIEDILRDLYKSDTDFSIALLRYFNPIGAHPSGLIGEDPNGIPNNLLPYIAKVATGEYEYLNVFGNDYNTVDGTGIRDYIHVVDLANAHLKAIDFVRLNKGVEAFNIGTGKGYSVLEVIKAFQKASNKNIPYRITERRPGDIGVCYANPAKAKKMLNWEAKYDIDDMCRDAWNFVSNKM